MLRYLAIALRTTALRAAPRARMRGTAMPSAIANCSYRSSSLACVHRLRGVFTPSSRIDGGLSRRFARCEKARPLDARQTARSETRATVAANPAGNTLTCLHREELTSLCDRHRLRSIADKSSRRLGLTHDGCITRRLCARQ